MKIKLVQSGGILPITKEAVTDVDWSKDELNDVLGKIALDDKKNALVRDGISHTIEVNNKEIPVDLEKADGKFATVFNNLKKDLKIIKN